MANYKVVDADQLDADIKTVADSIRAKTGGTEELEFPDGLKSAVDAIEKTATQEKSVDITANGTTEVTPDDGYALSKVTVNVDVAASGGGSGEIEGVVYVTFMSEDGTTELYKKPVFSGDDCMEPISRGWLDTPTKDPSAEYTYAYSGWSLTSGGSADDSALLNVTEDRTVYAAFVASTRYYTVRFFDGETLLHTVNAAYGTTVDYTYEKSGYVFQGWSPELAVTTSDIDYYGSWILQTVSFADGTWAQISEVCESGLAAQNFQVGDTKQLTSDDGAYTYTAKILAIDTDWNEDCSGKLGITVGITPLDYECEFFGSIKYLQYWSYTAITEWLENTFITRLPAECQEVMKTVCKQTQNNAYDASSTANVYTGKLFVPDAYECGYDGNLFHKSINDSYHVIYPGLANAENRMLGHSWWLRTTRPETATPTATGYAGFVNESGEVKSQYMSSYSTITYYVYPCFCI